MHLLVTLISWEQISFLLPMNLGHFRAVSILVSRCPMAIKLTEPYLLNILNRFSTKNWYPKFFCLHCSRSAALECVNFLQFFQSFSVFQFFQSFSVFQFIQFCTFFNPFQVNNFFNFHFFFFSILAILNYVHFSIYFQSCQFRSFFNFFSKFMLQNCPFFLFSILSNFNN